MKKNKVYLIMTKNVTKELEYYVNLLEPKKEIHVKHMELKITSLTKSGPDIEPTDIELIFEEFSSNLCQDTSETPEIIATLLQIDADYYYIFDSSFMKKEAENISDKISRTHNIIKLYNGDSSTQLLLPIPIYVADINESYLRLKKENQVKSPIVKEINEYVDDLPKYDGGIYKHPFFMSPTIFNGKPFFYTVSPSNVSIVAIEE